ncbi:MAG: MerR family transcriptional regulator [Pseudomonadota bacterium]
MKIAEVSQIAGLSISTIHYYERSGLCPLVSRGADGHRAFSPADCDWLLLLASLRATGMPMAEMRAFADLYAAGEATVAERKAALLAHRARMDERRAELDACQSILTRKLKRYDEILGGRA